MTGEENISREGISFFPLTCDYREYTYAAGKIPGGFFKREGRPGEREVLTWAAGGRFSYVILRQLGIPLQQAAVALGPSGVVHLAFLVPRKSKDSFYDAPVPTLPEDLTQTKEEAGQFMTETMRSGRLLRDETQLLPALMGAA